MFHSKYLLVVCLIGTLAERTLQTDSIDLKLDEDECIRYSVQDFYASIFEPMFRNRMEFLQFALEKVTDSVEEMLLGLEQRKKGVQDMEGVKLGINRLRQVAMLNLHKATFSVEESWSRVLNLDLSKPKSEGGASLSEMKDQIQNVLEILKSNEEELSQSFVQIAESAQHIVNTMVKVLKEAITKKEGLNVEEAKAKMLSSLTERGKILGIAMGHLVIAQMDKTEIAPYTFLGNVLSTVDKLDKEFYYMARKIPQPEFWFRFMSEQWETVGLKTTELSDAEIIKMLLSLFFHSTDDAFMI